jgi:hypothetical protein
MKTTLRALLLVCLPFSALAEDLKNPDAFNSIQNQDERSIALFLEVSKVITSPRCVNCHPAGRPPAARRGQPSSAHE